MIKHLTDLSYQKIKISHSLVYFGVWAVLIYEFINLSKIFQSCNKIMVIVFKMYEIQTNI